MSSAVIFPELQGPYLLYFNSVWYDKHSLKYNRKCCEHFRKQFFSRLFLRLIGRTVSTDGHQLQEDLLNGRESRGEGGVQGPLLYGEIGKSLQMQLFSSLITNKVYQESVSWAAFIPQIRELFIY